MERELITQEEANGLMQAIGAIVVGYAQVEHWIDGIVHCLYTRDGAAQTIWKRHPYNAKDEVNFIRECANTIPRLSPYKNEAIDLLDKLAPLSLFRHDIVHGHIGRLDPIAGTIEFSRIVRGEQHKPARSSLTITGGEIQSRGGEIFALIAPFMNLTHRLLKEYGVPDLPQ